MKNSILKTVKKYNLSYRVRTVSCGTEFVEIIAENIAEFEMVVSVFRRMRSVYVDSHFYALCTRIYALDEWEALSDCQLQKVSLSTYFICPCALAKVRMTQKESNFYFAQAARNI